MNNNKKLIILGAGRPHKVDQPNAVYRGKLEKALLQWQLEASGISISDVIYVGGYKVEEIKAQFPNLTVVENPDWSQTGSGGSLFKASFQNQDSIMVCYGDILFRPQTFYDLQRLDSDIAIAYDTAIVASNTTLQNESRNVSEKVIVLATNTVGGDKNLQTDWANGKFIGLVHFKKNAIMLLNRLWVDNPKKVEELLLVDLIELLRVNGLSVAGVDVKGNWAELIDGNEIANFVLGTKAESLSRIRGLIKSAKIQEQVDFTVSEWRSNKQKILDLVTNKFGANKLIVRSSAISEDTFESSNAGGYDSVQNVDPKTGLSSAIEHVVRSYGTSANSLDQILVQPMLQHVILSGVVFTKVLDVGAPWYVVNFEQNGDTSSITSGLSSDHRTLYVRRGYFEIENLGSPFTEIISVIREIESLLSFDSLDIEFALDTEKVIHILQVRPLIIDRKNKDSFSQVDYDSVIDEARTHIKTIVKPAPHIPGSALPLYGNMTDWNPAEIIGTSPSLLALSLYKYLILEDTWAKQRAEYGYRDVRPSPLLFDFGGKPYIDVRASFTSFVPASVSDKLAAKLLDFYLNWLRVHPELHDKVEFSVLPTCFSANMNKWAERLTTEGGFTDEEVMELFNGLHKITYLSFERVKSDLAEVKKLDARFMHTKENSDLVPIVKIKCLLEDCRRFGTLPFAHLARSSFVALTLLKDAVSAGVISNFALESFLSTISTVSHDFYNYAQKVGRGELQWEEFVSVFGHLRPGTYDINSPRYDTDPELFLRPAVESQMTTGTRDTQNAEVWEKEKSRFFESLQKIGLPSDPHVVEEFLRDSIQGREYAKFVFSRNLSEALECLARLGLCHGLSREDIAEIHIEEILALFNYCNDSSQIKDSYALKIEKQRKRRLLSSRLRLPNLITKEMDLDFFIVGSEVPNFIGRASVISECVVISDRKSMGFDTENKVVLIPQADPGYDWLFSKGIAGLITMYGGANSHMAIRCAEFGLPAAVGVGEQKYQKLAKAHLIELSPSQSTIKVIR